MFFERFRQDVRRYADGVHELGDPTPPALLAKLPAGLRDLYRSWNGMRLFTESIVLEPAERLVAGVRLGDAFGAAIETDDGGRIYELDEAGDRVLAGSNVERWLNAMM